MGRDTPSLSPAQARATGVLSTVGLVVDGAVAEGARGVTTGGDSSSNSSSNNSSTSIIQSSSSSSSR